MRVDGEVELLERQPILDRQGRLGDEVGRARPDDMRAQQLARPRVGHHLHKALGLPKRERATRGGEREAADFDLEPLLLRFLLAKPDVGDLRLCVHAVGDSVIVGRALRVPGDVLDGAHALVRGDVCEHDATDHVADRPYALGRGAQVLVNDHAATLQLDAGLLRT